MANLELESRTRDVPGRLRKGIICPVWGYTWDMGSSGAQFNEETGESQVLGARLEEEAEPAWQREG